MPMAFVAGDKDWGVWQSPGALEQMERAASDKFMGTTLINGAGHWVQQEQPMATAECMLRLINTVS